MLMPRKLVLIFQREMKNQRGHSILLWVSTSGPIAFMWVRHTCFPVNMSQDASIPGHCHYSELHENNLLWESHRLSRLPVLPCRGRPEAWEPAEAAAARGSDCLAGRSKELCSGDHRNSDSTLALGLGVCSRYDFILSLCLSKWRRRESWANWGQKGVNTVTSGFTWERMAMKILHLCLPPPLSLRTLTCYEPCAATGLPSWKQCRFTFWTLARTHAHQPGPLQAEGLCHGPTQFY